MKPLIKKETLESSVSNTLDLSGIDIRQGDTLAVLKTLLDESVNCVVTSPPYFHQRDYGTALWSGGDSGCDHKINVKPRTERPRNGLTGGLETFSEKDPVYLKTCKKCGAVRIDSQLGLEETPEEFVANMVTVFNEVKRVLKADGTCFLNIGDSYVTSAPGNKDINDVDGNYKRKIQRQVGNGEDIDRIYAKPKNKLYKHKDMYMVPFRLALALWENGWYVRQDIIWHKPNPTPESAKDRCTKAHEYIFLLTKRPNYYFDYQAIKEKGVIPAGSKGGKGSVERGSQEGVNSFPPKYYEYDGTRQKRSVWTVQTHPMPELHFASFPPKLITPCILAGSRPGDTVLDPFMGSGTVGMVCRKKGRKFIGIELNPSYIEIAKKRIIGGY